MISRRGASRIEAYELAVGIRERFRKHKSNEFPLGQPPRVPIHPPRLQRIQDLFVLITNRECRHFPDGNRFESELKLLAAKRRRVPANATEDIGGIKIVGRTRMHPARD